MNAKKINWLFAAIIGCDILAVIAIAFLAEYKELNIDTIPALLLSQAMLFVPALLFLAGTRTKPTDLIAIQKPKWITSLLVIVITYLCMPLIVTVNAVSMLFVENEVTNLQPLLQGVPAWQVVLMIGIIGPLSEEFVFRGGIYHGYRRSGRLIAAMLLSSVLFGLMHLNFNQMSYAILVGVIGVLLIEGTGNFFYSFLFHVCINVTNVIQIVMQDPETSSMDAQQTQQMVETVMNMPFRQAMCIVIAVYAVIACFTTTIAGCLYYLILKREGRVGHIRLMFSRQGNVGVTEEGRKMWSWPLVLSILVCLVYMTADLVVRLQ